MSQKGKNDSWQTYGYRMEDAPCEHVVPVNDRNDTGYVQTDRDHGPQDPLDDGAVDESLRGERSENVNPGESEFWNGPTQGNIERGNDRKQTALEKIRKKLSVNQKVIVSFLAFVAVALIAAVIFLGTVPRIRTIDVEGNTIFTDAQICDLAGIHKGDNLLFVRADDAVAGINRERYLVASRVETHWPDRVVIVVKEREPAAWLRHNGITYVIDSHGMVLDKTGDMTVIPDLLEVTGLKITRQPQLGSVLTVSAPWQLAFLRTLCVEMKAMKLTDLVRACDLEDLQLCTSDGCWVRLGSTDEIHQKLRVMTMVRNWLLDGEPMKISGGTIDVTNPREPTYEPPIGWN